MSQFLAFSGSSRSGSNNHMVADILARELGKQGQEAELISLADYEMPIYNGDLEQADGLPEATVRLKTKLASVDGLVITCPEYNGFMTPLLTNTIDWCTRSSEASVDLGCFTGKPVFIAAASPGPGGGGRAANHLKTMLSGIGAYVSPMPLTVPSSFQAFDDEGNFSDEKLRNRAAKMMTDFIEFTQKLS